MSHWPEFTAILTRVENISDNEVIESELFEKPELTLTGDCPYFNWLLNSAQGLNVGALCSGIITVVFFVMFRAVFCTLA